MFILAIKMEHLILEEFNYSDKFNIIRFLRPLYKSNGRNIIKAPEDIDYPEAYLRGLRLYLEGCKRSIYLTTDFTEADAYYAAVIAYQWRDAEPLIILSEFFGVDTGDKYY